jgi:hypothetical protein
MQDEIHILPAREPVEPGRSSTHNLPAQLTPLIGREQEVDAAQPLLDLLKAFLRDKHLLLVLDNFEQILPAAPHLTDLLAFCPDLVHAHLSSIYSKLGITSRNAATRYAMEHHLI